MLQLNIIDSELELVPEKMCDDYQIRKIANTRNKRPEEMILDSNYMHGAIDRAYPGKSNRIGRPDIFYHLLNVTQDSILNRLGYLETVIHTKNDEIIRINSETRMPKSYNRFIGLMEKLLKNGKVESPDGKALMYMEKGKWNSMNHDDYDRILLSPKGKKTRPSDIFRNKNNYSVFIGGFSEGDFVSPVYRELEPISIFDDELTIWTVGWEIISSMETLEGIR
jgi:rRNA small subunit pseudouridine methyltransferase Nep1